MIDLKKLKKKLEEFFTNAKNQTDEDNGEIKIEEVKTKGGVTPGELPEVSVTYPQKPTIETPVYERIEYTPKTDDEIASEAEEYLREYKDNAMKTYDERFENTLESKANDKIVLAEEKKNTDLDVNRSFDENSKKIGDDMLRQGIADSSISKLLKEKNEQDRSASLDLVTDAYNSDIAKIDEQIKEAEQQRQDAINSFNISYALKYSNKINQLMEARDKAEKDAIKYNNRISEKEFADKVTKEKAESDLYTEALDHYQTEKAIENKAQYEEASSYEFRIYNIFRRQLASMSKKEAMDALRNDPTYVENLNTKYYLRLVEEFGRGDFIKVDRDYGVSDENKN